MPFSMGAQGSHDDTSHQGSAKKGIASGVASLDAASKVVQEPASKAQASGIASLDAASKVVQEPASKAQASGIASLDASSKVVQEPASKGAASGVASLDASGHVTASENALCELLANKGAANGYAPLNASSKFGGLLATDIPWNTGSYAGNDGVNRAIAHGLGRAPKSVIITRYNSGGIYIQNYPSSSKTCYATGVLTNTVADSTNFYVTTGDNDTGNDYSWAAI